ncbi:CopG family transcriptional regulator [Actinomadura litoris]|uniref:ribbon-helix-helix domain-containing protein n=1 Tax=Actinomadura litoris TaxID=2678616 RepID=UPI001FA7583F|nr:CopG family transcriptional regulator [Actinomadura litoris]
MTIYYYGNLDTPDQLRKVWIRRTRALISIRMGITDPVKDTHDGHVIPEAEEMALYDAIRELGGWTTGTGCRVRFGDAVGEADVLALAERLWGAPVATADDFNQTPTPLAPEPAQRGGARPGAGRPEVGKPTPVRLGDDLTARVDKERRDGESRAAAIRRLLEERLGGPTLTRKSAQRALLGIGAALTGDDPVVGSEAHYRALAVLLDDADYNLAMRPSVVHVASKIEWAVEELAVMLTEDEDERDLMEQIVFEGLAERAARRLASIEYRNRRRSK